MGWSGPQVLCCSRIVLEQSQTTRTMADPLAFRESLTSFDDCENSWTCSWTVQIFHKWWLWVLLDRLERRHRATIGRIRLWWMFICSSWIGSGLWRECSRHFIPTQVHWWRGKKCHLPVTWWPKEKRGSPEGMFVFMRFVKGNQFLLNNWCSFRWCWFKWIFCRFVFFYMAVFWKSLLTVTGKNWVEVLFI